MKVCSVLPSVALLLLLVAATIRPNVASSSTTQMGFVVKPGGIDSFDVSANVHAAPRLLEASGGGAYSAKRLLVDDKVSPRQRRTMSKKKKKQKSWSRSGKKKNKMNKSNKYDHGYYGYGKMKGKGRNRSSRRPRGKYYNNGPKNKGWYPMKYYGKMMMKKVWPRYPGTHPQPMTRRPPPTSRPTEMTGQRSMDPTAAPSTTGQAVIRHAPTLQPTGTIQRRTLHPTVVSSNAPTATNAVSKRPTNEPSSPPTTYQPTQVPQSTTATSTPTAVLPASSATQSPTNTPSQTATTPTPSTDFHDSPTHHPTTVPSWRPTANPSVARPAKTPTPNSPFAPSLGPTGAPTVTPNMQERTGAPVATATATASPVVSSPVPSYDSVASPTTSPTGRPTGRPMAMETEPPTANNVQRTNEPTTSEPSSERPTSAPVETSPPTGKPTSRPSDLSTPVPSSEPTRKKTKHPTGDKTTKSPSAKPTPVPSINPVTMAPSPTAITSFPTSQPTSSSTQWPTVSPSSGPTVNPTHDPSGSPTNAPSVKETGKPTDTTAEPSDSPTKEPTAAPFDSPTVAPSSSPTKNPTVATAAPAVEPVATLDPSSLPTSTPTTTRQTEAPSKAPSRKPTSSPTIEPTPSLASKETEQPTSTPTTEPTSKPTPRPTKAGTEQPTTTPTKEPTAEPTVAPTLPAPDTSGGDNMHWQRVESEALHESYDGELFGSSLSVSSDGNIITVGAWANSETSPDSGRVARFDLSDPTSLAEVYGTPNSDLGYEIGVSGDGDYLAVFDGNNGIFVFLKYSADSMSYQPVTNLDPNKALDGQYPALFSGSLSYSLSGDGKWLVLVGESYDEEDTGETTILVLVYEFDDNTNEFSHYGNIIEFGLNEEEDWSSLKVSVTFHGDFFAIAQIGVDEFFGTVRAYDKTSSEIVEVGEFTSSDEDDGYGQGVEIVLTPNGDLVLAIAVPYQDLVLVFVDGDEGWDFLGSLIDGYEVLEEGSEFGSSISLSDDATRIAVGARNFDGAGGAVQVFDYVSGDWQQKGQTLTGPEGSFFGDTIDLNSDGTFFAVGAPVDCNDAETCGGSVFLFREDGT